MASSKTSLTGRFMTHIVPAIVRPLRVLWNEVIGFLFIALAVPAVFAGVRNWKELERGEGGVVKVLLPALWALVMGYFGVSSFLKARKISRS